MYEDTNNTGRGGLPIKMLIDTVKTTTKKEELLSPMVSSMFSDCHRVIQSAEAVVHNAISRDHDQCDLIDQWQITTISWQSQHSLTPNMMTHWKGQTELIKDRGAT